MTVQDKINKLLWDRRCVVFPSDMEIPDGLEYVMLLDLTLEDRNRYIMVRDLEERKNRAMGVPTEGELLDNARAGGYWGDVETEIESHADEHLAFLEAEFNAKKKFKSRQNIIKKQIEDTIAKQEWVKRKRNDFRMNSAGYLAHEVASFSMLRRVAMKSDETPLFPDDQTFLRYKKEYPELVYFLLNEVITEGPLETHVLRQIARSPEWRLVWTLSRENLSSVFGRPSGDLTLNQRMVTYWSRVYDSAFESHEPPEHGTIDDDDLFDQWLANRDLGETESAKRDNAINCHERGQVLDGEYVEQCTCGAKMRNKGKYLGERERHAPDCLHGTWHRYTPEEKAVHSQRIYGRNSNHVRNLIDKEQEQVLNQGVVEEQDLRGKNTRQLLGMKSNVIPIK
jgi:hypothetical protein